ncbi:MAG: transcriptional regulator with XRE-family HTH domain/Zn-dependent peptidase ImmA (M78 family) [Alteromonadaceae bacterium]|jgi:transcriptional regulator with XRE-family HTH domain/Zn-dependent peptidase ImmA (M78 family)
MASKTSLMRKSHFLGTKIRNLRKRNHLTIEDLSARCIKIDADSAPSVSYLSMIERGKRVPSEDILEVIAQVFQKDVDWFLDGVPEGQEITPVKGSRGGISGMALEPSFLFSKDILQIAIPEMLSQTGTTGRQFAHLLIRAHQEHHQNHFPDLERVAEQIGQKRMPLSLDDIIEISEQQGLKIKWFTRLSAATRETLGASAKQVVRSYFKPPSTIYINEVMRTQAQRLKYDLAVYIGHSVLHNKEGVKSIKVADQTPLKQKIQTSQSSNVDAKDILTAWRDFESSFFAGALLCPKVPFRQLLDRHGYDVEAAIQADVSPSVAMRRMTAVSPYPHWHYFDAYAPGKLKAVYRGNGIPLPWGNMRMVEDPCQHWAVFRMINAPTGSKVASAQISILNVAGEPRIYCCNSLNVEDLADHDHVLCAGIDLNPAIEAQGKDANAIAQQLQAVCIKHGGSAMIPKAIKADLIAVAKILNIAWIERGIESEVKLICSRGGECPRIPKCYS